MVEMSVLDACSFAYNTEECFCLENISPGRMSELENLSSIPLHASLPHSVYSGTWKQYGWWWHYLLDRTPGWWNNHGEEHIKFSDVIAFALAAELSTAVDAYPKIVGYAAGAFANKGKGDGFYKMIGSRQSVFMRVNNALYGSSFPAIGTPYNFEKFGSRFDEIYDVSGNARNIRMWGDSILRNTGFTDDQRLAYEWGNPTNRSPQKLKDKLKSFGNMGPDPTEVLYFTNEWNSRTEWYWSGGLKVYELAFVITEAQMGELCGNASCVNP
jgi:hypothetical protein